MTLATVLVVLKYGSSAAVGVGSTLLFQKYVQPRLVKVVAWMNSKLS